MNEDGQHCRDLLSKTYNNKLGLDQTFFYASILLFITGMGFGTSFSLVHVDCIDWVHTGIIKRLLRAILGSAIAVAAYEAC